MKNLISLFDFLLSPYGQGLAHGVILLFLLIPKKVLFPKTVKLLRKVLEQRFYKQN